MSKLPKGWEYPKLEEIFEILKGNGLSKGKIVDNGKYKCVLYGELYTTYAEVINKVISSTNEEIGVKSKKGDILLPASTTTKGEDLANAVALNEENVLLGGDINIFRMKKNNVDSIFMAHYLTHIKKKDIANLTQGSTIIHLYGKNIKHLQVHLPPLEEQKKIADILTTVDKKIAFVEENISATEELKKGLMQKLLTEGIGHTEFKDSELGRIPESWEVKSFYNIASIKHGYAFKSESFSSIETDNVVLTPGNVKIGGGYNHKYFRFYDNTYFPEEYILKKNDLIISMTDLTPNSATLGYPFFVPEIKNKKFLHNQRLGKVEINFLNIDKVFLFNFLCTDTYRNNIVSEATGTTVKHTSPTRILSQLIPIPPLEEQKQIAEIFSTVDNKLENLKEKKQSFEELKKGLMQKLLTGEVRV